MLTFAYLVATMGAFAAGFELVGLFPRALRGADVELDVELKLELGRRGGGGSTEVERAVAPRCRKAFNNLKFELEAGDVELEAVLELDELELVGGGGAVLGRADGRRELILRWPLPGREANV